MSLRLTAFPELAAATARLANHRANVTSRTYNEGGLVDNLVQRRTFYYERSS